MPAKKTGLAIAKKKEAPKAPGQFLPAKKKKKGEEEDAGLGIPMKFRKGGRAKDKC